MAEDESWSENECAHQSISIDNFVPTYVMGEVVLQNKYKTIIWIKLKIEL